MTTERKPVEDMDVAELEAELAGRVVPCPCGDRTDNQCARCKPLDEVDGLDMWQCPPECDNCHGSGTVPKHGWIWKDCHCSCHVDPERTCSWCNGTSRYRIPASHEAVEKALLKRVDRIALTGSEIPKIEVEWTVHIDGIHVQYPFIWAEGTTPDECRLRALVAFERES